MSLTNGYKSILRNSAYLGVARIITSASRAIYAFTLAALLGAQYYGSYYYGLSWYLAFLPISVLGMNWILSREIGTCPLLARNLIAHTFSIRFILAFILTLVSIITAYYLEPSHDLFLLLTVFSIALFFRSLAIWFQSVFVAQEKAYKVLSLESIFRTAEVIVGVSLLIFGFGLLAIAINHVIIWLLQDITSWFLLKNSIGSFLRKPDQREYFRIIKLGSPFMIASLFGSWLLQGSIIMYRHLEGTTSQLGYLALALQAFIIVSMIAGELGNAALPVLARSIERKDGKTGLYIQEVLRFGVLFCGVLVIGSISLGELLITNTIGEEYNPVARLLPWSMLIVCFYFWISSLEGIIGIYGHLTRIIIHNAFGALVFTCVFYFLVPEWGNMGVIVALGAGLASVAMSHIFTLIQYHQISWDRFFLRPIITASAGIITSHYLLQLGYMASLIGGLVTLGIMAFISGAVQLSEIRRVLSVIHPTFYS